MTDCKKSLDAIAKLCGAPKWDYPWQVVRDVADVVAERDSMASSLVALRGPMRAAPTRSWEESVRIVYPTMAPERARGGLWCMVDSGAVCVDVWVAFVGGSFEAGAICEGVDGVTFKVERCGDVALAVLDEALDCPIVPRWVADGVRGVR